VDASRSIFTPAFHQFNTLPRFNSNSIPGERIRAGSHGVNLHRFNSKIIKENLTIYYLAV
jgi:hypothetical protein